MPQPFALVSSREMKVQECFEVLRELGGVIDEAEALAGRLSQGDKHGWVALDNSLLNEYEAAEIDQMRLKLGGQPQAHILLDVSRTAGSEQLAVAFASMCAERWPCVVYNLRDNVISATDVLRLRQAAMGFEA